MAIVVIVRAKMIMMVVVLVGGVLTSRWTFTGGGDGIRG